MIRYNRFSGDVCTFRVLAKLQDILTATLGQYLEYVVEFYLAPP